MFQRHFPDGHWQAIETGSTGLGIPDLNGVISGVELWIELKLATAIAVDVRPEQVAWIERRVRAGGRAFIAVRCKCSAGARRVARDELHLYNGSSGRRLKEHGLNARPLGAWAGGPTKWDWKAIRDFLISQ